MIRVTPPCLYVLVYLTAVACQLKRPDTVPTRMLEPQLLEPQPPQSGWETTSANAAAIRLLDTQARGHIGRRVLYQQPSGELTEDATWLWSSSPERYLDAALRLELASSPELRLVDAASAQRSPPRCSSGTSSLPEVHGSSARSNSSSRGPIASSTPRSCEPASRCRRSSRATWPLPLVVCCAASHWTASRAWHAR